MRARHSGWSARNRADLKDGNWKTYKKLLQNICALQSEKKKDNCLENAHYLWNNREAARLRCTDGVCASCTKTIAGHVLSERLSRTPFAWSETRLGQTSMLVGCHKNEQVVTAKDIRVSTAAAGQTKKPFVRSGWSKYNDYMNRQIDMILSTDWTDAFEAHSKRFGKVDASYLIRKSMGVLRSVV